MRSVVVSVVLLGVGGCASISMYPEDATATFTLSTEQSALRSASSEYATLASDNGWVETQSGLTFLHSLLSDEEGDTERVTYASVIDAETAPIRDVLTRISTDAEQARMGLALVADEARVLMASGTDISREDVASFEKSLVFAQGARRSFAEAIGVVVSRSDAETVRGVDYDLQAFDTVIDETNDVADALANYALREAEIASS